MPRSVTIEIPDEAYKQLENVLTKDGYGIEVMPELVFSLLVCNHCKGISRWCSCDNDE